MHGTANDAAASSFDETAWRERLLELNPWARGLTIDENSPHFAAARHAATLARRAEGKEAWNGWAKGMLALKATLEEARQGQASEREPGGPSTFWDTLASAVFSNSNLKHRFDTNVSLVGFVFPSHVVFATATFSGPVCFTGATFAAAASFDGATFSGIAWFDGVTFTDGASFGLTTFSAIARFHEVTFNGAAWFNGATFISLASFVGTSFTGSATFDNTNFSSSALFAKATFGHAALFHNATFSEMAWFGEATFIGEALFRGSAFKQSAIFQDCHFQNIVIFDGVDSAGIFSLTNATFKEVPSLFNAAFKGALRLDNVVTPRYPWLGYTPDKDATARFRELRRRASEAHDHERELECFAQEIRTGRFRATCPLLEKAITWLYRRWPYWRFRLDPKSKEQMGGRPEPTIALPPWAPKVSNSRFWLGLGYEVFSDFGRSPVRPLIWWGILTWLCAAVYLGEYDDMRKSRPRTNIFAQAVTGITIMNDAPACAIQGREPFFSTDARAESIRLSLQKGLVFDLGNTGSARRTLGCLYGLEQDGDQEGLPARISTIFTVQRLLSGVLIFLSLLAVRNQLRLK